MRQETKNRQDVIRYLQSMDRKGWVANHDGNVSVRIAPDRFLCTPTGMAKVDIQPDQLIVVDSSGKLIRGRLRLFSEWILHRAVYESRPEVMSVMHSHAPYATALGAAGVSLPHPFLPEAVVSLGPEVPSVPIRMPGKEAVKALESVLGRGQSCLIEGNGLLSWGTDLEQAFLRMELVEHLAKIAQLAQAHGGVRLLNASMIQKLTEKHVKANLAAPEIERLGQAAYVRQLSGQVKSELSKQALSMGSAELAAVVEEVTQLTLAELKK